MTLDEIDRIVALERKVSVLTILHVLADAGIAILIAVSVGVVG